MGSLQDWRATVKGIGSIYELDPIDVLIVLRHEYLECAKSLYHSPNKKDQLAADNSCDAAESLQRAIEINFSNFEEILISLEPATIKK